MKNSLTIAACSTKFEVELLTMKSKKVTFTLFPRAFPFLFLKRTLSRNFLKQRLLFHRIHTFILKAYSKCAHILLPDLNDSFYESV
jgi:hypothetical protein